MEIAYSKCTITQIYLFDIIKIQYTMALNRAASTLKNLKNRKKASICLAQLEKCRPGLFLLISAFTFVILQSFTRKQLKCQREN